MPGILTILQHTPLWAFAVLALLVIFGIQALRARTVSIWRLLIVPAVFIGWGIISIATRTSSPILLAEWAAAAAVFGALGWTTTRAERLTFDRTNGLVYLPGSILPLIRNLTIFAAKYSLAVAVAVSPAQRQNIIFWDIAVSGASAGYFLGWLARLALAQRRGTGARLVV
jgi:hypothetical protein